MNKFLDLNPLVPRDRLFVDTDENFQAYQKAGFGRRLGDFSPANIKLKAPNLSAKAWWRYLTNVNSLAPIPKNLKFGEVPEGIKVLGGTFVIEKDQVLFAHADAFPGDAPAVTDVLRAASVSIFDSEEDASLLL